MLETAENLIAGAVSAAIKTALPDVPLVLPNFTIPDDEWVVFLAVDIDGRDAMLAGRSILTGAIIVTVRGLLGIGAGGANQRLEAISSALQGLTLSQHPRAEDFRITDSNPYGYMGTRKHFEKSKTFSFRLTWR